MGNQMATRGYTRKLGLSLDQLRAIDLFLVGQNDTEVARNLNLHRVAWAPSPET